MDDRKRSVSKSHYPFHHCFRMLNHSSTVKTEFSFQFLRISVDGDTFESDTKTMVCTENILSVFGAKTSFLHLFGLVEMDEHLLI